MSTKPKRTKLSQFPCPWEKPEEENQCTEMCSNGDRCRMLPVYRQAIADHKCARLLRTFEVNLGDSFERTLADVISRIYRYGFPGLQEWRRTLWQFTRLRRYIRDALCKAGLE